MTRSVVLGIDSGTQSTKVLALDIATGEFVASGRAPHSGEDTQNPADWWSALQTAMREITAEDLNIEALSVAGQQHGCVLMDAQGEVVRPAPLWNNLVSAPDTEHLNEMADFAAEVGSRLVPSFTITKLANIARTVPEDLSRATAVGLPHDWLNFQLTGQLTTDRGDASGTGWWSPREDAYRHDLITLAIGKEAAMRMLFPEVRGPQEPAGSLTAKAADALGLCSGIPVGPGTGDNMAAALGVGAKAGEIVISLGTSGTAFAVSDVPTADPTGEVAGFADATGRFLLLTCMLNCTRVVDTVARLLSIDRDEALARAGARAPGAGGMIMLPYLSGERTPNLPHATGMIHGMTEKTTTADLLLRAALDGVVAGLAYCVDALARQGVTAPQITLVGGGAIHPVWQQAVADATDLPVIVRSGGEHAARGAAIQAAAVARNEPIIQLSEAWCPDVVTTVSPRAGMRESLQLDQRLQMIRELAATTGAIIP